MRRILLCALLASAPALPAAAQLLSIDGILVEPRHPTTSDRIRLTVAGVQGCAVGFHEAVYDSATGLVVLNTTPPSDCVATPIPRIFRHTYEVGPLPAGQHFAELRSGDSPAFIHWRELFEVREDTGQLDLGVDDRFQVRVEWSNPRDGSSGTGHPRRLARDSGAFWFFSQDNLEVTVKILDGRAVNGRWWVFIASMTDLQFEVEISRAGGPAKTWVQNAGANRNFIDINASFEEGTQPVPDPPLTAPAIAIDPEHPAPADPVHVEVAVHDDLMPDLAFTGPQGRSFVFAYQTQHALFPPFLLSAAEATVGPLPPGVYAVDVRNNFEHDFGRTFEVAAPFSQLYLQDDGETYFNVYVHLDPPLNGVGHGVTLTRESGYFWFFDPDNIELTVKILDGRAVNGKFWVFIASMTTVPFTVEVERCMSHFDPFGCGSQLYRSVQGVNRNFIDIEYP